MLINNHLVDLPTPVTLTGLVERIKEDPRFSKYFQFNVIVAMNGDYIHPRQFSEVTVTNDDAIQLMIKVAGG